MKFDIDFRPNESLLESLTYNRLSPLKYFDQTVY